MLLKRLFFILILLPLLTTCVEQIPVDLGEPATRLVVDGLITDKPGPYSVKLTTTAKYSTGSEGTNLLVKGAKVTIGDDTGNSEQLTEFTPGVYRTQLNGIQGQVGRSYTLNIETSEGNKYQSKPELLSQTPGVDTLYYEFKEAGLGTEEGFHVFVDTKDPAQTEDFYKWTWTHYERAPNCFFGSVYPDTKLIILACCGQCWDISQCNGCVNIASDQLVNGNTITGQLLAIVPYTSTSDYFLYYEQQSLSRDGYKFWKALEEQTNNVGGIFDKPPAIVRGNLFNVENPDDVVLGFFGASSVKVGAINIKRTGVGRNPSGPPPIVPPAAMGPPPPCASCEESAIRTAFTPPFWKD